MDRPSMIRAKVELHSEYMKSLRTTQRVLATLFVAYLLFGVAAVGYAVRLSMTSPPVQGDGK